MTTASVDLSSPAPTTTEQMDAAVGVLRAHAQAWGAVSVAERLVLLDQIRRDTMAVAERWAALSTAAEGLDPEGPFGAEETLVGPYLLLRNIRLLRASLEDIAAGQRPTIPGPIFDRADGRIAARIFPFDAWDRIFYTGVDAEVWMEPGVTRENLGETQAISYFPTDGATAGTGVSLVLGAGNVSSISPMDTLYKLFVENRVVLLKMHPLNAFLGPVFAHVFSCLAARGFFRVVYGGAQEGAYLSAHPDVDDLHVTGSDRTYDAIVFGSGAEGRARKVRDEPINSKPFSSELGNVSPMIVVPGPWSDAEIRYHAESVAASITNNAGFNCNASRVIVTWAGWTLRDAFLNEVRAALSQVPCRKAYYPGAHERFATFAAAHPEIERLGKTEPAEDELPWGLIANVSPESSDDLCFRTEAFCSVLAETALPASDPVEFLSAATRFVNETVWGTLNATILVHPASRRDPAFRAAFERTIADLRYGTIGINHWAGVGYGLAISPWGAFPGHVRHDIQSGTGFVHNTLMFSRAQKTVLEAPFRTYPKPMWFPSHKTTKALAQRLWRFEAEPSVLKLPGILGNAIRG